MSKYKPLSERLSRHKADRWTASFAELEEVLGFPLPKAAREQNAWWRGGEKSHHAAWSEPGWRVIDLDRGAETVVFGREAVASPAAPAAEAGAPPDADTETGPATKRVLPTAVVGGAAALLAGGVAVLAGILARRKGDPWR